MRRLAPLLALLVVAGCDTLSLNDVRGAAVFELVLEDVPARQPDGDDWDGGITSPDPDVYLVLETQGGEVLAETAPLANVSPRDLPVLYPIPEVRIGLDEPLFIVAYDDDGLLEDELVGEIGPFRARDFLTSELRESFRVVSDREPLEVRLRIAWTR